LQKIGLAQLLAINIIVTVVAYTTGFVVRGAEAAFYFNLIFVTSFLLVISGCICLAIGHEKRVELRDQEDTVSKS
jgi:hypothetical protein